jgi:hypothetical protein
MMGSNGFLMIVTLIASAILGACWRRWFGSARPEWAFTGYRVMQVLAGIGAGLLVFGPSLLSLACAGAAVGFMTLPISVSRRPFEIVAEWAVAHGLPVTKGPFLQGPSCWAEVLEGAVLFFVAALVAGVA